MATMSSKRVIAQCASRLPAGVQCTGSSALRRSKYGQWASAWNSSGLAGFSSSSGVEYASSRASALSTWISTAPSLMGDGPSSVLRVRVRGSDDRRSAAKEQDRDAPVTFRFRSQPQRARTSAEIAEGARTPPPSLPSSPAGAKRSAGDPESPSIRRDHLRLWVARTSRAMTLGRGRGRSSALSALLRDLCGKLPRPWPLPRRPPLRGTHDLDVRRRRRIGPLQRIVRPDLADGDAVLPRHLLPLFDRQRRLQRLLLEPGQRPLRRRRLQRGRGGGPAGAGEEPDQLRRVVPRGERQHRAAAHQRDRGPVDLVRRLRRRRRVQIVVAELRRPAHRIIVKGLWRLVHIFLCLQAGSSKSSPRGGGGPPERRWRGTGAAHPRCRTWPGPVSRGPPRRRPSRQTTPPAPRCAPPPAAGEPRRDGKRVGYSTPLSRAGRLPRGKDG